MGEEFWAAHWHVVCQAKKIETYKRPRGQGYLKSTKKKRTSPIFHSKEPYSGGRPTQHSFTGGSRAYTLGWGEALGTAMN